MRSFRWILTLGILYWSLQSTFLVEGRTIKMAKEIPTKTQLLKTEMLKNAPGIENKAEYFTWPSSKKISACSRQLDETVSAAEKKMAIPKWVSTKKETVTEAKRMAEKWIRTILQDRWIPKDIYARLIALDSDIDGYDTVRVRYAIDGYYIQIVQTSSKIALTIKAISQERPQVPEIIKLFLNESEKVKKVSMPQIGTFSSGLQGKPDQLKVAGASNQWWGSIYWWTNNKVTAFFISKFYGGAGVPVGLPKNWF